MDVKKKYGIIAICVVVFGLFVLLKLRNTSAGAAAVPPDTSRLAAVSMVRRGSIDNAITLSGEFHPFQEVDIHAKVAGYLKNISVDVGDRVRLGQTIGVLEIPELNAELQSADASVRNANDAIERAQSELESAKSTHDAYHSAYSRLKQASESRAGLIAEQELDDSQAKDKEAEAQISVAQATLSEARSQLAVAQGKQQQMTALSDYSRITAPFDGVITQRYADTGALIQAGTSSSTQAMTVVQLAETDKLRLVIPVPESAVSRIKLGTGVNVRVPALNRTFSGVVARFADALDTQTRTMHTEIDVKNTDNSLVDGMYAEVDIVLAKKDSALVVPTQAVSRNGSDATVLTINAQNQVEQRHIELGLEGNRNIEVLGGLKEHDLVLIGGGQFRPGEKVTPKVIDTVAQAAEAHS